VILAVALSAPALAQCEYKSIYTGPYRSTALDLALDGMDLWVATSYGVAIYDRGNDPPVPVTSQAIPGPTTEIEIAGQYAYAASGNNLYTLRRNGSAIELVHSLALGATANDLIAVGQYLYVASSTGVIQIDLLVPDQPAVSNRLSTTAGAAFSVASLDGFLYAADGDTMLDLYTIRLPALPQKIGTLLTSRHATSVRTSNGQVFVSDDVMTEVFAPDGPSLGTIPFGASSIAPHSSSVIYASGSDRRVRAVDVSAPNAPIVLFEQDIAASPGSVNRIGEMISAEGRLYVAAGDLGLLAFDARSFAAPFPLRAHALGSTRSVFGTGTRVFSAPESGGLHEFSRSDAGALSPVQQWDAPRISSIHDGSTTRLLTVSGATVTVWDIGSTPPSALATANLRAAVRSAALLGSVAYAVLVDGSLWRVEGASSSQVSIGTARPSFIARGGSGLALADLNDDGTTTVRWFANGDPASVPGTATFEGAATSGIAATPAGFVFGVTFRGLLAADFTSATPSVITYPRQGGGPARGLSADGNELFLLTAGSVEVWDVSARQLRKSFPLPSTSAAVSIHASGFAYVATSDGVVVINDEAPTAQPQLLPYADTNLYYTGLTSAADRVHLVRDGAVRSIRADPAGRPAGEVVSGIPRGSRDVAAIADRIYAVSESGRVTGGGAEFQISEGADASALSLHAVRDALYLSITRGCLSGGCEKKTLVLSTGGGGIAAAGSLPGGLVDVEVHGDRAYAVFDDPDEIRILDVRNAASPSVIVARPAEGNAVGIAYSAANATVYAIGQEIYAYAESTLVKAGEILDDYVPDPSGRVSYVDQSISISGSCAVVAGREFAPRVFHITGPAQWQPFGAPASPAAVRAVVTVNGAHYLLSDYALEIWSAAPPPKRRRPVR
jgi:hypothetical protein